MFVDKSKLPKSLNEAKDKKSKYYYIGPCSRGHDYPRYTASRCCTKCKNEQYKRWLKNNPNSKKRTKYHKDYYLKNKNKIIKYKNKWDSKNRKYLTEQVKNYHWKLRLKIIIEYGGKCECCGETTIEFLTIDHIDGKGAEYRRKGEPTGKDLYLSLLKRGCPKDNYRLLCMNCNFCLGIFGYCAHKHKRKKFISKKELKESNS